MNMQKISISILLLFISLAGFSQWECPSKLPVHLKPFYEKVPLNWAAEITPAFGVMTDRTIMNGMVFGALQFVGGNHEIYVEGGMKYWENSNELYTADDRKMGLREAFYGFSNTNNTLRVGFQSMTSGDYLLVNERAYGVAYDRIFGAFTMNLDVASVTKDFSRAGVFCTKSYLYNLVIDRPSIPLGSLIGETNFGALALHFDPQKHKKLKLITEEDNSSDDEFQEFEEFESFDEFEEVDEEVAKDPFIQVSDLGLVVYNEFGAMISDVRLWGGAFGELQFPWDVKVKGELLWQNVDANKGTIAFLGIDKVHFWPKGNRTIFSAGYFAMLEQDINARAFMSFSNMWYGEVMRLDGVDMPFYQLAVKHNFPKIKTHFKLQYVDQLRSQQMSELDLAVGKTFWKFLKVTAMVAALNANELNDTYYMSRVEMRITF